jgi:hypothetical protein
MKFMIYWSILVAARGCPISISIISRDSAHKPWRWPVYGRSEAHADIMCHGRESLFHSFLTEFMKRDEGTESSFMQSHDHRIAIGNELSIR